MVKLVIGVAQPIVTMTHQKKGQPGERTGCKTYQNL